MMAASMDMSRERTMDELLVLRCQAGEHAAFDLLIRRWQRRLWGYARRLTGREDAAWDATQEAWVAILRRIRSLSDPAWFAAWAFRIVRNKCADQSRRANRHENLTAALAERQRLQAGPSSGSPTRDTVTGALQRLSRDRQELLLLKYSTDLNIYEIAMVLGVPAGTVKSRLHHAREELRQMLEGDRR